MGIFKRFAKYCTKVSCNIAIALTCVRGAQGTRLAFIMSSVAAAFPNTNWLTENIGSIRGKLVEINKALEIADNVGSLELPMMMHSLIWDDAHEKLCEDALKAAKEQDYVLLKSLCTQIVQLAPKNLRYGRQEDMAEDISAQFCKLATVDGVFA